MSTDLIVRHCAPTLAGLKIGNLFSCRYTDYKKLQENLFLLNTLLNEKGVHFVVLRTKEQKALIYVYRKQKLENRLHCPHVRAFLQNYNYEDFSLKSCLCQLKKRLENAEFPHEIGVFLGYPLSDITSFIEHKGQNYKCTGYWKVYTDEQNAQKTFAQYKKCTRVYCQRVQDGFDMSRLTVAG